MWWSPRETHSFSSVIRGRAKRDTDPLESGSLAEVSAASFCSLCSCAEKCSHKIAWRNSCREDRYNRIGNRRARFRPSCRSFPERPEFRFLAESGKLDPAMDRMRRDLQDSRHVGSHALSHLLIELRERDNCCRRRRTRRCAAISLQSSGSGSAF